MLCPLHSDRVKPVSSFEEFHWREERRKYEFSGRARLSLLPWFFLQIARHEYGMFKLVYVSRVDKKSACA